MEQELLAKKKSDMDFEKLVYVDDLENLDDQPIAKFEQKPVLQLKNNPLLLDDFEDDPNMEIDDDECDLDLSENPKGHMLSNKECSTV